MKRTLAACLLGLGLSVSAAWSQATATEQAVAALEQKWLQSQKTNNPDLIAPLLADNFVSTSSEGKVTDKAGTLATAKTMKWDSVDYNDVKVSVFGDAAIATGGLKGKGTDGSGKAVTVDERWTDTWVKMSNGQWLCVASHATSVKM